MAHAVTRSHRVSVRSCGVLALLALLALAVATTGACARLGFSDRVLARVPSPDGQLVAVCQEVPAFDGPDFAVRLERPDGSIVRRLYEAADGDRCSEVAWAPDGRTLAVLIGHVARVRFIDVAWALDHPALDTHVWSWREVSFSSEQQTVLGRSLRFTAPLHIEIQLCPSTLANVRRTGRVECAAPPAVTRIEVPRPIVTGHPARS